MRREAWGDQATRSSSAQLAGARSGGGSKLATDEATARIFVYDLDANIPKEDLEQGLHGLFAVFGSVVRVSCLPAANPGMALAVTAGWKDTVQAIVVFAHVDPAKQAMARLQNFPIWGRQLRLAYSRDEDELEVGDVKQTRRGHIEHPATAPQQRRLPSSLRSPAGDRRAEGKVSRRIWDEPEDPSVTMKRMIPMDSRDADDESDEPSPKQFKDLSTKIEKSMERFDRIVMERLQQDAKVLPPSRPDGPMRLMARTDVGGKSPTDKDRAIALEGQGNKRLLDGAMRHVSDGTVVTLKASPAWQDRMPEQLHPAHITSESTIENQSDTEATDYEGDASGLLVGGLDPLGLADREAGSRLTVADSADPMPDDEDSEWSDSSEEEAEAALALQKERVGDVWRESAPTVNDLEEGEDYGDEGEVDMEVMAALFAGDAQKAEQLKKLQDALNVARCMRELDQLMGSLKSIQEAEESLQAGSGVSGQSSTHEDCNSANAASEEALFNIASRLDAVQSKLSHIPPEFLKDLGLGDLSKPRTSVASEADASNQDSSTQGGHKSSEGSDDEYDLIQDEDEYNSSPLRHNVAGLDEAFGASSQEGTEEEDQSQQESGDVSQTEAEVELQMRLEAQNLEDAMLSSELQRELQDLSDLQGQIAYLKEMLRKTKQQQRLLQEAETDEARFLQDCSKPSEDEDAGENEDETEVYAAQVRVSPSSQRSPHAGARRGHNIPSDSRDGGVQVGAHVGLETYADSVLEHVPRPTSRLSEGRPHSRLSWADEEGGRRFLPSDDAADFPSWRPTSRPTSRLSRLSESNASDSLCPTPDVDELDAMLLQSSADLRDIRLAVLFSRTLNEGADRLQFLVDFIHHFHGRRSEHEDTDFLGSVSRSGVASRNSASGGVRAGYSGRGGSNSAVGNGVGWNTYSNMWAAPDQEEEFDEEAGEGEEGATASRLSSPASSLSGMGSAAWSKFSTLPRPSPRSGSISVGLGSIGSDPLHSRDQGFSDPEDPEGPVDTESEEGQFDDWQCNVTELQILNEIRSLPKGARKEALLVIQRLAGHHVAQGSTSADFHSPSRNSSFSQYGADPDSRAAAAGRARFTRLTDSEDDEDVLEEVPPGGAGVEETEDDEAATASSWRSVEDDVSNDSTLARLSRAQRDTSKDIDERTPDKMHDVSKGHERTPDKMRTVSKGASHPDSSSSGGEWGSARKERPQSRGRERANISVSSSPAMQGTPQRRTNYFVDNLDLESPNKLPEDGQMCFDDESDACDGLLNNSRDLVLDLQARACVNTSTASRTKPRHDGHRRSGGSSSSVRSAATPTREQNLAKGHPAQALYSYDYAESVSSTTANGDSEVLDSDGPNEHDEHASASWERGKRDADRDIAKEMRLRISNLVRERQSLGFVSVSFTHADLDELAKLVIRLLRNNGSQVDEQLRCMLHNALNKYRHVVIQEEGDQLVHDVSEILQKERVFHEVVARMQRGWEQEMRDYQQYPAAVRGSLMQQLQERRDKELMILEKERRARGHSNVQNVHSDSPDDSGGSRASVFSDEVETRTSTRLSHETDATDFSAILDAAVQQAVPRGGSRVGAVGNSRSMYEDLSSSAECASEDTHSSSRDSASKDESTAQFLSSSATGNSAPSLSVGRTHQKSRANGLELRFEDAEFEEITIADLPDVLADPGGKGGETGKQSAHGKGGQSENRGKEEMKRNGRALQNIIEFGPGGVRIPSDLEKAMQKRRQTEQDENRLWQFAKDFAGEDRLDPKLFDAESTDEDGMSPPDRMPSAQDREKRLLELAAMQNEMLAAINATTQAMSDLQQEVLQSPVGGEEEEAATTVSYAGTHTPSISGSDEEFE